VICESLQAPVPDGVADALFEGVTTGVVLGVLDAAGVGDWLVTAGVPDVVGAAAVELEPRPVSSHRTPSTRARTTTIARTRRTQ
jgi:hypothetical protein